MTGQPINVFVSYSKEDASLVAPVVRLLRVNTTYVFQDVDGIRPGKRWQEEIARGIAESNLVVVFWCRHAHQSVAVSEEWSTAIEQKKDLLPLLLDATPLPGVLREFQYIDFRGTVGENHGASATDAAPRELPSAAARSSPARPMPASAPKLPARWLSLGAVAAVLVIAVSIGLLSVESEDSSIGELAPPNTAPQKAEPSAALPPGVEFTPPQPPQKSSPPLPEPPPTAESAPLRPGTLVLSLIGAALAAAFGWLFWSKRRRRKADLETRRERRGKRPHASATWENTDFGFERQMASRIEAEIARRTGG